MKIIIKTKYLIIWIIIWLSLISAWVYATGTQPGKIGSLFEKIWSSYKLRWDEIKDNTVDNSEIENNAKYQIWKLWIRVFPSNNIDLAIWDNDTWLKQQGDGNLAIFTNNSEKIRIKPDWKVWIWTTSPSQKLDVNWSIQASSWVRVKWSAGLYFQDHGGWWNMTDNSWIRSYWNKNVYINKMLRADDWFQVDGKTMISSSGYTHTAQSTNNSHYGLFEVKRADGKRWAYFGYGNWWNTVNIRSDYASKFYMNQNLEVHWSIKTTCIWNCF